MNRRTFLKIMAATLATQALPGCIGGDNPPANGQRILILGAGIAGLAAAATLPGYDPAHHDALQPRAPKTWLTCLHRATRWRRPFVHI